MSGSRSGSAAKSGYASNAGSNAGYNAYGSGYGGSQAGYGYGYASGSRSGSMSSETARRSKDAEEELRLISVVPQFSELSSYSAEDVERVIKVQAIFRGRKLRKRIEKLKESKKRSPNRIAEAVRLLVMVDRAKHGPGSSLHSDARTQHTPGVLLFGKSLKNAFGGLPIVWRSLSRCEKVSYIFALMLTVLVAAYFLWFPSWVGTVLGVFFYDAQGELSVMTLFGWLIVYVLVAALSDGTSTFAWKMLELRFVARSRQEFGNMYFNNLDVLTIDEYQIMEKPLDQLASLWFIRMPAVLFYVLSAIGSLACVFVAASYRLGLYVLAAVLVLFFFGLIADIFAAAHIRAVAHIDLMMRHVRSYAAVAPAAKGTMATLLEQQARENRRAERYHTLLGIFEQMIAAATPIVFMYIASLEVEKGRMTSFDFSIGFFFFLYALYCFYRINQIAMQFAELGDSSGPARGMIRELHSREMEDYSKHAPKLYDSNDDYDTRAKKFQLTTKFQVPWLVIICFLVLIFSVVAVITITCSTATFLKCTPQTLTCTSSLRPNAVATLSLPQDFNFVRGCFFTATGQSLLSNCATVLAWNANTEASFPVKATVKGWRNSRGYSGTLASGPSGTSVTLTRGLRAQLRGEGDDNNSTGVTNIDQFVVEAGHATFTPPTVGLQTIYANTQRYGKVGASSGTTSATPICFKFYALAGDTVLLKAMDGPADGLVLTFNNATNQLASVSNAGTLNANGTLVVSNVVPTITQLITASGFYYATVGTLVNHESETPFRVSYEVTLPITPAPKGIAAAFSGAAWNSVSRDFSWVASEYYCATLGQAVCVLSDVCALGSAPKSTEGDTVQYAPVADAPERWTKVVDTATCGSDTVTNPVWTDFAAALRFRGAIACCNATQVTMASPAATQSFVHLFKANKAHTLSAVPLGNTPPVTVSVAPLTGGSALAMGQSMTSYTPTEDAYLLVQVSGAANQQFTVSVSRGAAEY